MLAYPDLPPSLVLGYSKSAYVVDEKGNIRVLLQKS